MCMILLFLIKVLIKSQHGKQNSFFFGNTEGNKRKYYTATALKSAYGD